MGQWSSIAMQPTVAAETLVNNWAANEAQIIETINKLESDLATDNFSAAGQDLAEVLQMGLGELSGAAGRADKMLVLEGLPFPPEKLLILL
mmetsp:Transcript_22359/g.27489  ORF Transcript_22359/g.27489 Transcript_22359/m.27489 type:complete len:91 (+) Transcript_22359:328-600(+)